MTTPLRSYIAIREHLTELTDEVGAMVGTPHRNYQTVYVAEEVDAVVAKLEWDKLRAEEAVFIPGSWNCPQCKFAQTITNLYVNSGTVGPNTDEVPLCPNDGSLMRRDTWKERVGQYDKRLRKELDLVDSLKQQLATQSALLKQVEQERDALNERLLAITGNNETTVAYARQLLMLDPDCSADDFFDTLKRVIDEWLDHSERVVQLRRQLDEVSQKEKA